MPSEDDASLTFIEAVVLGLLVEQRGHGFELAKALEPGGWLSEVFTTRRAIVYRALKTLRARVCSYASRPWPPLAARIAPS